MNKYNIEFIGDLRILSDNELLYQLSGSREVAAKFEDINCLNEIVNKLSPARKNMALALIELYRRMQSRKKNYKSIRCSDDIYNVMHQFLQGVILEECWAIFMNQANKILHIQRISTGGLASTLVDIRLVLREALKNNATSFILVHNHPSGNIKPSADDDRLTQSMTQAAKTLNIRFLDHLVYCEDTYYSYADEGFL